MTFPSVEYAISDVEAFEAMDTPLGLLYMNTEDGIKKIYSLTNSPRTGVNALTGEVINYDGSAYTGTTYLNSYLVNLLVLLRAMQMATLMVRRF